MSKLIAVYGSLRIGEYNYERFVDIFGKTSITTVEKTKVIDGFDLYSLGSYPAITRGSNKLTVDILEVTDNVHNSIKAMELGAGYDEETIHIENIGDVVIYTYPKEYLDSRRLVESGDWSNYLKQKSYV